MRFNLTTERMGDISYVALNVWAILALLLVAYVPK